MFLLIPVIHGMKLLMRPHGLLYLNGSLVMTLQSFFTNLEVNTL
jgi:hypothetical protein